MPKKFEVDGKAYELVELGSTGSPGQNSVIKHVDQQGEEKFYLAHIQPPQRMLEPVMIQIVQEIR